VYALVKGAVEVVSERPRPRSSSWIRASGSASWPSWAARRGAEPDLLDVLTLDQERFSTLFNHIAQVRQLFLDLAGERSQVSA